MASSALVAGRSRGREASSRAVASALASSSIVPVPVLEGTVPSNLSRGTSRPSRKQLPTSDDDILTGSTSLAGFWRPFPSAVTGFVGGRGFTTTGQPDVPTAATPVRVRRQRYIAVENEELHQALAHTLKRSGRSDAAWQEVRRVLGYCEAIYGVEYQRAGNAFHQTLHTLNNCVVVPDGSPVHKGSYGEREDSVYASPQQFQALQEDFILKFQNLAAKSHFGPVSARDCAMADALNCDYLTQLFIEPQSSATDGALVDALVDKGIKSNMQSVAVWKRGWGVQRQDGILLGAKLDYLQQLAARRTILSTQETFESVRRNLSAGVQATARAARRAAAAATASFYQNSEALATYISRLLPDAARGALGEATSAISSLGGVRRLGELLEHLRVRLLGPEAPPVLPKSHKKTITWRLAHLMAPSHDKELVAEFNQRYQVDEPARLSPTYITRVTVGDALGGTSMTRIKSEGLMHSLKTRLRLDEPTFQELLVLCRPKKDKDHLEQMERAWEQFHFSVKQNKWRLTERVRRLTPRVMRSLLPAPTPPPSPLPEPPELQPPVKMRVYQDVPVPIWQVCYPFRKVAFKPVELLKMDLMALVGVTAIMAQITYGNHSSSLQLVWASSLMAQALRVVYGYTRMYSYFDGYVHKTLHQKTVVSEGGIGQFLAASASTQQYRQTAILYSLLARGLRETTIGSSKFVPNGVVTFLPEVLAAEAEKLMEQCGHKVCFPMDEALEELKRLRLVVVLHANHPGTQSMRVQVMNPTAAASELEKHWRGLLTDHISVSHQPSSLWQYSFWDRNSRPQQ